MNTRLKLLTDQLSGIFDQIIAEFEQTGHWADRDSTIKQRLQAGVENLKTIDQLLIEDTIERQRIQDALKTSNQELKDFIYMTSHDFREPLRKIASFGSILKESLDGKIEQEDQENLDFMIDGAERMTQMIEDLLAYSRINTRTITIEKVNLNDMVEELEKLDLGELLEETGARIEVPEPLSDVQADPALVRQLLRNLLSNAITHRKKDGNLHIVMRTERMTENAVKVECKDNGIGIEAENDRDIFKMSLHSHSRQEYEEAGTGLAVCKKIVDRHGGRIGIESKAGGGSTLWFTLPISKHLEPEQKERLVNPTGSMTFS